MRVCSTTHFGLIAVAALVALMPVFACSQTAENQKSDTVLLADGMPIHLVLMDDLQGKKLLVKQVVHFEVREDLIVDSKLIVRTGTEAIGHIEAVSKSGLLGKSGRLVSGTKIMLRGGAGVSGGKGGALTGLSAMWYGPNANLPVGTTINAYVSQDQRLPAP